MFEGKGSRLMRAATAQMKLSISARIGEVFGQPQKTTMNFDQFLQLAAGIGYQAICMRASLGGIQTPLEQLREMSRKAKAAGLRVSMVTGNPDTPANNDQAPLALRQITLFLDLAEIFGANLIRVQMKREEDIV